MTVILSALIASTLAIPSLEVISHFICPSLFMCGLFLSGLARIISLSHRDHRLSLSLLAFCCLGCQLNSSYSPTLLLALRSNLWSLTVYSLSLGLCYLSLSRSLSQGPFSLFRLSLYALSQLNYSFWLYRRALLALRSHCYRSLKDSRREP